MGESCEIFSTEYRRHFVEKKSDPPEPIIPRDYIAERIEEGEIDRHIASIPKQLDESAEKLILKHILDNERTTYQVTYKNPWEDSDIGIKKSDTGEGESIGEKDYQSELLADIRKLYFAPDVPEVLAPPVTSKRVYGYIRPKLLHGHLSAYQDTYSRTGGLIMLENRTRTAKTKIPLKRDDSDEC